MSESGVLFTDNMLLDNVLADGSSPKKEDALRSSCCLLQIFVGKIAKDCEFCEKLLRVRCNENLCKMTHTAIYRFLERVRLRLEGRPQDYSDFLKIMRVKKSGKRSS